MGTLSFNSNINALTAIRRLTESSLRLSNTFARVSSGSRINKASDDAAGLAIASGLNVDARIFSQGVRNVNDGISLLNIADASVDQLTRIVTRLRELATQSANGTYSGKQRIALDKEAQALSKGYNRIARTTSFNGVKLFDANNGDISLQAGYSQLISNLGGAIGDGTFQAPVSYSGGAGIGRVVVADMNGDGKPDIVTTSTTDNSLNVLIGNGDGTFQPKISTSVGSFPLMPSIADFNGDGIPDVAEPDFSSNTLSVLLGVGDGTFRPRVTYATDSNPTSTAVADFNGDGIMDIGVSAYNSGVVDVFLGKGDGSFGGKVSYSAGAQPYALTVADMNGDGITDIITTSDTDNMVNVLLGSGDGTFRPKVSYTSGVGQREVVAGDFNGDGLSDIATVSFTDKSLNVFLNNGDGTLAAKTSYADGNDSQGLAVADVNGDGKTDIVVSSNLDNNVNVFLGNGDGTFQGKVSYAGGNGPRQVAAADVNGDGVVDLVTASRNDSNADVLLGNSLHGVSALQPFTLTTRDGAKSAMTYFDQVQTRLSTQRSQIGAFQSRAEYVTHVLGASVEATKQAEGRIRDADMAEEVANGTRERILQEMGATVLQHAINDPQLLLQLLHE